MPVCVMTKKHRATGSLRTSPGGDELVVDPLAHALRREREQNIKDQSSDRCRGVTVQDNGTKAHLILLEQLNETT